MEPTTIEVHSGLSNEITISIDNLPAAWKAATCILARTHLNKYDGNIQSLCSSLGISRASAYAAITPVMERLSKCPDGIMGRIEALEHDLAKSAKEIRESKFENEILKFRLDNPGCISGALRQNLTEEFKSLIIESRKKHVITLERAAEILKISVDTLKKFSRVKDAFPPVGAPDRLPENVKILINEFLRQGKGKKSVKEFCRNNPSVLDELQMSYRQVVNWLSRLGFVNPKGIFLKNTGLDKILRFKPNQVWGTDGKVMIIVVQQKEFRFVWQCLIDFKTTVIVGGAIGKNENTENLLEAIRQSKEKTGIVPMAIVLDNRLSENLPAIKAFLDKMNIEIIKTFPGNPKSAAIVEGNFAIFERWVGRVEVAGEEPAAMARSFAAVICEIFTQMRSHKPRPSFSHKSGQEVINESKAITEEEEKQTRDQLRALANRFNNEHVTPVMTEEKKQAIELAIEKSKPSDPETFTKKLSVSCFTSDQILQAISALERQKATFPEKKFDHHYFGGIVRNLADQKAVEDFNTQLDSTYTHHWSTMAQLTAKDLSGSLRTNPTDTCTRLARDYLGMPVPAFGIRILFDLKECFFLASKGCDQIANQLRRSITDLIMQSKKIEKKKREALLCKLYEWENFVRRSDRTAEPLATAITGNA